MEGKIKIIITVLYVGGDWNGVPAVSPRAFPVPGPAAEAGIPGGSRHAQVTNLYADSLTFPPFF